MFTVNSYFSLKKQILGDLKTCLAIEVSLNNTFTHGKLQRCQTQRSDMQITAEIMQTYGVLKFAIAPSNGSTLLKNPPHNTTWSALHKHEWSDKRSSDPTENGKCIRTNVVEVVKSSKPHLTLIWLLWTCPIAFYSTQLTSRNIKRKYVLVFTWRQKTLKLKILSYHGFIR